MKNPSLENFDSFIKYAAAVEEWKQWQKDQEDKEIAEKGGVIQLTCLASFHALYPETILKLENDNFSFRIITTIPDMNCQLNIEGHGKNLYYAMPINNETGVHEIWNPVLNCFLSDDQLQVKIAKDLMRDPVFMASVEEFMDRK